MIWPLRIRRTGWNLSGRWCGLRNIVLGMALAFPGNKRQLLHRVLRISRQENKTLGRKGATGIAWWVSVLFVSAESGEGGYKIKVEPVVETVPRGSGVSSGSRYSQGSR